MQMALEDLIGAMARHSGAAHARAEREASRADSQEGQHSGEDSHPDLGSS